MQSAAAHRHDHGPALIPIRRRAFAFDMDGVVYRGPELIPGAAEAVAAVQHLGLPTLFITNNSRETPVELAAKLQGLGIDAGPESIVSAVVASVSYLRAHHPIPCRVLVLGGESLATQIADAGYELATWDGDDVPEVVVVGVDFGLTYDRLRRATRAIILDGARYLAVNTDPQYPTPNGPIPGAGAMTAAVAAVTGQAPVIVGKPSAHMFQVILDRAGVEAADLVVLGDMLTADIAGARAIGAESVLVLTGTTSAAEAAAAPADQRPDHVIESLYDLPLPALVGM